MNNSSRDKYRNLPVGARVVLLCGCVLEKVEQPKYLIDAAWFSLIKGCGITNDILYGTHKVVSGDANLWRLDL